MPSELELSAENCALCVIDVQERLVRAMPEVAMVRLLRANRILCGAARELGVRCYYSEQYPKGLGPTLPEVERELGESAAERLEKLDFSACGAGLGARLESASKRSVVLIGMEAHVCVYMTARDLRAAGFAVHVVADGVVSRREDDRQIGLELCRQAGAAITSSETVAFDWLVRAGSDVFKRVSALVR